MRPASEAGGGLARTLPGRFYHDPAIWQLERERIFSRLWVCVGRADQFPAVDHYRTARVGDESVLVVRGEDGGLRAFLNVCRHRGAQLYVIVHTLAPLAPDRSRVTCDWLLEPAAAARPGFDPTDTVALFDRVNRQDWEVWEWVQAGARSRAFAAGGVYVPIEAHIRGFDDFVLEELGLTAADPDAGPA